MKKHTKIYLDALGLTDTDFVPSELSGLPCVDIHHIEARGMGGSKKEDRIENLQAVTREEHLKHGDKRQYKKMLFEKHLLYLEFNNVIFDREYIERKIEIYHNV